MSFRLQGVDELALLLGRHTAKDCAFFGGLGQRLLTAQRRGVHPALGPHNACVGGHMADGLRVVARNDLHGHALLGKVAEGLGRVFPDAVLQRQQRQKFQLRGIERGWRVGQCGVIFCQQQHAAALGQQRCQLVGKLPCPHPGQHIRRTDDVAALRTKILGAVLVRRVEGHAAPRKPVGAALPEAGRQSTAGVIVGLLTRVKARQNRVQRCIFRQWKRIVGLHGAFGDRAGLVHTESVHPGQRLNAVHIAGQHLAAGQAHHAHGQGYTGQQVQPLGDHADERRDRRVHGVLHRQFQHPMLLPDQHRADGN